MLHEATSIPQWEHFVREKLYLIGNEQACFPCCSTTVVMANFFLLFFLVLLIRDDNCKFSRPVVEKGLTILQYCTAFVEPTPNTHPKKKKNARHYSESSHLVLFYLMSPFVLFIRPLPNFWVLLKVLRHEGVVTPHPAGQASLSLHVSTYYSIFSFYIHC